MHMATGTISGVDIY